MTQSKALSHPSVELKLPLDGMSHHCVIPTETPIFLWRAVAPGTTDRLAPVDTLHGREQVDRVAELRNKVTWSVSLDGRELSLLDESPYRNSGYRGIAWWIVNEAVELPAVIDIQFETTGKQPTVDGEPLVCWTDRGRRLQWNERIESTIHLQSPASSDYEFETHREKLWNRHRVYEPLSKEESGNANSDRRRDSESRGLR